MISKGEMDEISILDGDHMSNKMGVEHQPFWFHFGVDDVGV